MSVDAAFGIFLLMAFAAGGGFIGGHALSADYWAFRTRRREMEHAERMALIAQRDRLLSESRHD